jgi:TolB-like protein/DNA-binding winged helix-turn-helix (wHTH) protein/tetratricopeptide (TPR) repeat protein
MSGRLKAPIRIGDWIADPQTDTISRRGETQKLEPRTMRLLLRLAETPGDVLSVDQMLSEVWHGVVVGPASVYQAISQLRRTLGDSDAAPSYLSTVPRKGYRLIAAVSPVDSPPAAVAAAQVAAAQVAAVQVASQPTPPPSDPVATALQLIVTDTPANDSVSRRRIALPVVLILGLIVVLAAVVWISRRYVTPRPATAYSIVVLPFIDMTEGGRNQIFCDGLTEELSNWLAQIPTLRVVARTSAFAFRGQHDTREIGKALNTTHVLEGSMRQSGDRVRVTVQLIDARTGYHVWASEYDPEGGDTIKMQEEIARAVAESLQIQLTPATVERFAARRSSNSQAYDVYLLANHYQHERTHEANLRAIELYQQAQAADPNFALAYVGLAYAYLNQRWLDSRALDEVSRAMEPLLEKAERLDPHLSELYAVRGALYAEQDRFTEAESDLNRAVALNPNDSWAYGELGRLGISESRPRDALPNLTRALALDPLDYTLHARQCIALQDLARYEEATAACARARALQAEGDYGTVVTSWLEWSQGHLAEALQWNEQALRIAPNDVRLYELRGDLLLTLGMPKQAREVYEQALVATHDEESSNIGLAFVAYYEGGIDRLRSHLRSVRLDDSEHARTLIADAYLHVLAQDPGGAKALLQRAMSAANFRASRLTDPWFTHWGDSDLMLIAVCESLDGDHDVALTHLKQLTDVIEQLLDGGERRFQVYELQAKVLALQGDADGAMQALTTAASMGWRRAWWAEHEPFFVQLRPRSDFRALLAQVDTSNRALRSSVHLP